VAAYLAMIVAFAATRSDAPRLSYASAGNAVSLVFLLSSAFLLGALLATWWADGGGPLTRPAMRRWWLAAGLVGTFVGVFPKSIKPLVLGREAVTQFGVVVAAAGVVAFVLSNAEVRRRLEYQWIRWLGRISFMLYLIHLAIQRTVMDEVFISLLDRSVPYNVAALGAVVAAFALTLGLSDVLAVTVDRTALSFGKRRLNRALGLEEQSAPPVVFADSEVVDADWALRRAGSDDRLHVIGRDRERVELGPLDDLRQVGGIVAVDQEHAVVAQGRSTGRRLGHRAASQMGIPSGRAGAGRKVASTE
jgi:peptidoglycan/LPS O-acetylase OafA/YrhL